MWGGDKDATATRIGVEVAAVTILAVIGLVLFNPNLGPSLTALMVGVLLALDVVMILALLGLFPRIRSWWRDRKTKTKLNRHPILVHEMVRLVQQTYFALYENAVASLLYMTRVFTNPDETLPNEILRYGQVFRGLMEMSQTHGPWDRSKFATLVRSAVIHFDLAESILDRLYVIVARAEVTDQSLALWETFRERYNHLRNEWLHLSNEMLAVIGLEAQVRGAPARALQPLRIVR